ncbi:MAG: glycosyltransferase family 9 protein, partial [Fimbriimonadales bacterium]
IRREWAPSELWYFGGTRTKELQDESPLIDRAVEHVGVPPREVAHQAVNCGPFDIVVNMENSPWAKSLAAVLSGPETVVHGPVLDEEGRGDLPFGDDDPSRLWRDPDWCAEDLLQRHPALQTGHISEILCRACALRGEVGPYAVPESDPMIDVPQVLVATAASSKDKLWPGSQWRELLWRLHREGCSVGLLGAAPQTQRRYWVGSQEEESWIEEGLAEDLRGRLSLSQVVGAARRASLVVCLDNGVLHLAAATSTPIVGIFRHGIHRLWAPRVPNLRVLTPGPHRSVAELSVDEVWEALPIGPG